METTRPAVLTFGHGTAGAAELARLLTGAGVRCVVDVRSVPGSRRNPDAGREALQRWLPGAGLGYRWDRRLGGWRRPQPDSPDTALRHRSFLGYAGHMRSPDFLVAIGELLAGAAERPTAVMCAESLWWRCHRKMIADFLVLATGTEVRHLLHDGSVHVHRPSPEARLDERTGLLVYDVRPEPIS
ncbi:DUF488 domain-containing protein [Amycolatopsis cynarae]|uniref:DUF488 domain-containing protein n=1 Tax=Amycolatopsis cynarae TaxID=2995223 RepID=A0ABY7BBB9_9PSEU|nr:DUF488 domain-containing protein [Amycolatopsis sp. HUAS 11-8]WAL69441.1 DUF488 domain-containing protein [Amycolatopsis sp. HUAS 11-8]